MAIKRKTALADGSLGSANAGSTIKDLRLEKRSFKYPHRLEND